MTAALPPEENRRRMAELAGSLTRRLPEPAETRRRADRCGDCPRARELVRYAGPLRLCRECAAKRDRGHGLAVADGEWR